MKNKNDIVVKDNKVMNRETFKKLFIEENKKEVEDMKSDLKYISKMYLGLSTGQLEDDAEYKRFKEEIAEKMFDEKSSYFINKFIDKNIKNMVSTDRAVKISPRPTIDTMGKRDPSIDVIGQDSLGPVFNEYSKINAEELGKDIKSRLRNFKRKDKATKKLIEIFNEIAPGMIPTLNENNAKAEKIVLQNNCKSTSVDNKYEEALTGFLKKRSKKKVVKKVAKKKVAKKKSKKNDKKKGKK